LNALCGGQSVGKAISRAVEATGSNITRLESDLLTWFHDWAAEGFFQAVELEENLSYSSERPSS
jgi:hypothetical protein